MTQRDFEELAGRIGGSGQAVLRLTAALETQRVIDGPALSEAWRAARQPDQDAVKQAARRVLHQLADDLDGARRFRQSQGRS